MTLCFSCCYSQSDCRPTPCSTEISVNDSIVSLSYIDVCIDGVNDVVSGLHDSGAQISVIHPRVVSSLDLPSESTIKLRGLFGDAVDADLVTVTVTVTKVFILCFLLKDRKRITEAPVE